MNELKEDMRVVMRRFVEVNKRKGLKVNVYKSKIIAFEGKEELVCQVTAD